MLRTFLAFVLAPFPAAFLQSLVVAIWPKPGQGVFEHPLSMFVAMCLLFYAFGLVLGLPLALALRYRGSRSLHVYGLAGVAIILTPIILALLWVALAGQLSIYAAVYHVIFFGFGGFAAGALFWLISRPDRRQAKRGTVQKLSERFS